MRGYQTQQDIAPALNGLSTRDRRGYLPDRGRRTTTNSRLNAGLGTVERRVLDAKDRPLKEVPASVERTPQEAVVRIQSRMRPSQSLLE